MKRHSNSNVKFILIVTSAAQRPSAEFIRFNFNCHIKNCSLYFSARRKANKKFNVRICDDVLIGVLSFGRRRHFSMLEPHGTRFKYFIERYWPDAPLLILDMDCWKYEKVDDKVLIPDSIPF